MWKKEAAKTPFIPLRDISYQYEFLPEKKTHKAPLTKILSSPRNHLGISYNYVSHNLIIPQ
jgi:hypothetical protein